MSLLASTDPVNLPAVALSSGAGWLMFLCLLGLATFFVVHREDVRNLLLRLEDPRATGTLRITFGLAALCNINELSEHFIYLFTDEGLFPTAVARHYRAREQFAGFGDGIVSSDPAGFFDYQAVLTWLKGPNYSLLLFDSSPSFFYAYLIVFEIAMIMFIVGFQTRWVKWIAWFLYHGLLLRNQVFWEGSENVYRTVFFYLCLSRCDAAYSVDNWLRCRRLRRQGRLDEGGAAAPRIAAAGAPPGVAVQEPIYRAIPFWPRFLVILQLGVLYMDTGVVKNGSIWTKGDSFYFALNLDHFYRYPPQQLSAIFGTNLFRLNTHVVHYWECFFPVVVLGLVGRWALKHRAKISPTQTLVGRLGLGLAGLSFLSMVIWLYPVHYTPEATPEEIFKIQVLVAAATAFGSLFIITLARRLYYQPFEIRLPHRSVRIDLEFVLRWLMGRRLWLGLGIMFHGHLLLMMNIGWFTPGLLSCYVAFFNGRELAEAFAVVARFLADRGIPVPTSWTKPLPYSQPTAAQQKIDAYPLPLSVIAATVTTAALAVPAYVMSRPGLVLDTLSLLDRVVGQRWALPNLPPLPKQVELHHLLACAAAYLIVVAIRLQRSRPRDTSEGVPQPAPGGTSQLISRFTPALLPVVAAIAALLHRADTVHALWFVPLCGALGLLIQRDPAAEPSQKAAEPEATDAAHALPYPPEPHRVAYGPIGRALVGTMFFWHCAAVGIWLLPDKQSVLPFREPARELVKNWLSITQTSQGWAMFAPNPPKRNVFMRAVVTDGQRQSWDLHTDVYACFMPNATKEICDSTYPIPWIWYSRTRKMNRRVIGSEGGSGAWYGRWHARYLCREWERTHNGERANKVELFKVTYPVPEPEEVAKRGPYDPKTQYHQHGSESLQVTVYCETDQEAQLTNEVRARHGLPAVDPQSYRPFQEKKCLAWEKKLLEAARERGETVSADDPRFKRCLNDSRSRNDVPEAEVKSGRRPGADAAKDGDNPSEVVIDD